MKILEKNLKVSVCVVTYNQEKYIRQCLQSIVDQKTDFCFDIIVGDDCSTDSTRAIVCEFKEKYPEKISLIFHEKNIGASKNYSSVHNSASGEYISHVDGDDYIFPGKLQAQKEILDAELSCNIVWHRMKIQDMSTGILHNDIINVEEFKIRELRRSDLLELGTVACHSSKMYRAKKNIELKFKANALDYYTDIIQIGDGYAVIINKVLGVYRFGIGIAANSNKTKNLYLEHINELYKEYPEYKIQIGANAFWVFLVELKNIRSNAIQAFLLWWKCGSFTSIILVLKKISLRRMLRTKVW